MHDPPAHCPERRAGVLVISVWIDELAPGELLASIRTEEDPLGTRYISSEAELLEVISAWLSQLRKAGR